MNRIMLLGLLVRISRVALCGVMGVMAETVARRAGSIGGTRRRNDADGSADSISCEPMNKENE